MTAKKKKSAEAKHTAQIARVRNPRLLVILLCIALSALAVVPFFFMGASAAGDYGLTLRMPATHDMFLQYDQMRSFYNGLAAGEIYPRWEEDTNRGFGAATTSYYPPGIYYLTSALYAVTRDWLRTLLDAHLLMMIASAAALYLYAREVMSRRAALVAMAAYIFLPYHIADQYQRGALAELLGFIWMPLVLLFGERLMGQDGDRKVSRKLASTVWLALSYGGFLWSHPPTAYQFTLGFGVYLAARTAMTRQWQGLIWVGAGMAMGLGLSAAYLLPAFVEQDLIHREFIADIWPYHKTYIFVHDLYGTDLHRGFFHSLDAMWILGTFAIVVCALLVKFKLPSSMVGAELRRRTILWIALGSFASLMMLKLSQPVGMFIPKIEIGVFTWRMLSITTLVMALLAGACAEVAIEATKRHLHEARLLFRSFAMVVLIGGVLFSAGLAAVQASAPVFIPESEHFNAATLPRTAPSEPATLPKDVPRAELRAKSGAVIVKRWDPELRSIYVEPKSADRLLVRTFNFPGWTAMVDGKRIEIITGDQRGEIGVDLLPGAHEVSLEFLDTPVRRIGKQVTLVSFGLLLALSCAPLARRAISRASA